jgi:hypothetical protein
LFVRSLRVTPWRTNSSCACFRREVFVLLISDKRRLMPCRPFLIICTNMGEQRECSRTSLLSGSLLGTWVRQLRLTRLSHGCSANLKVTGQSDIPLVVPDPALHPTSLGFEETKCPRIAFLKERTSFQSFWGSESKSPDEFRDSVSDVPG